MIWYKYLYVSENIAHRKTKIKWKIHHNVGQINIYVITLASGPHNLLEIISASVLMQRAYPKQDLFIVGLAKYEDEARDLAARIIMDVYEKTGNFDVRDYLLHLHETGNERENICP